MNQVESAHDKAPARVFTTQISRESDRAAALVTFALMTLALLAAFAFGLRESTVYWVAAFLYGGVLASLVAAGRRWTHGLAVGLTVGDIVITVEKAIQSHQAPWIWILIGLTPKIWTLMYCSVRSQKAGPMLRLRHLWGPDN